MVIDSKAHQLTCYIDKTKRSAHAPFLFAYVMAALWDLDPFNTTDVAMQATSYNMVKIGLTAKALEHMKKAIPGLVQTCGLKVKDPVANVWLTDADDGTESMASTIPSEWGATTAVYAINVPPYYDEQAVNFMYMATGQKDFVHSVARWSVGEIRTVSWKIIGPEVDKTIGTMLKATDGEAPVHIISSAEYDAKKAIGVAKRGGKGGKGGQPTPLVTPADMETDEPMFQFMRKRPRTEATAGDGGRK